MSNDLKTNMTSSEHWVRLLHMLLFALALYIAILITWFLVVIQFLFALFTGGANQSLQKFSDSFSTFIYQVIRFLTYNTDEKPFPFSDWPEQTAAKHEDAPGVQSEPSSEQGSEQSAGIESSAASAHASQAHAPQTDAPKGTEQTSDTPVESEPSPAAANDEPAMEVSDAKAESAEEGSEVAEEKEKNNDPDDKAEIDKK